jgi:hypothetical protein
VVERTDVAPDAFTAEKTTITNELLQRRRQEFFSAYMTKAKLKMKIDFNEEALRALLGR